MFSKPLQFHNNSPNQQSNVTGIRERCSSSDTYSNQRKSTFCGCWVSNNSGGTLAMDLVRLFAMKLDTGPECALSRHLKLREEDASRAQRTVGVWQARGLAGAFGFSSQDHDVESGWSPWFCRSCESESQLDNQTISRKTLDYLFCHVCSMSGARRVHYPN